MEALLLVLDDRVNDKYNATSILPLAINDVGAALRMNVDRSHRRGLELAGERKLTDKFTVGFNTTKPSSFVLIKFI